MIVAKVILTPCLTKGQVFFDGEAITPLVARGDAIMLSRTLGDRAEYPYPAEDPVRCPHCNKPLPDAMFE